MAVIVFVTLSATQSISLTFTSRQNNYDIHPLFSKHSLRQIASTTITGRKITVDNVEVFKGS
jgi:hypothetical protein